MDDQCGKDLPEKDVKLGPDCELRFEVENTNETVYLEVSLPNSNNILLYRC